MHCHHTGPVKEKRQGQNGRVLLNLQPRGDKAKAYQVKQVRTVIVFYNLAGESDAAEDASQTTSEGEDDG
jgi:hypothetical protein